MNEQHSENMQPENLFSGFSAPNKQEWIDKVQADLKDTPFEKLIWKTLEGIDVQPMYFREDLDASDFAHRYPGDAPFVRGTNPAGYRAKPNTISQELPYHDAAEANASLRNAVQRGQTGLELRPDTRGTDCTTCIIDAADFRTLLDGIDLTQLELHIDAGMDAPAFLALLNAEAESRDVDTKALRGSVTMNPFKSLMLEGTLPMADADMDAWMADTVKTALAALPNVRTIGVDASVVQNAGGNAVQEIACALAMAVEYADRLTKKGLTIDEIAQSMRFTFAAGPVFFTEIAKYRAARLLWAKAVQAWRPASDDAMKMNLHARTSRLFATKYDPWVNMLRATVESMAAMLGGADQVTVLPFDSEIGTPDEFSLRVARNTQIVLQEESHIAKLADPAAGSFYVDSLTQQFAEAAWKMFQQIEAEGGFVAAMKSGMIQKEISAVAEKRIKDVSSRKQSILGTNVYPNLTEKPIEKKGLSSKDKLDWKTVQIEKKKAARGNVGALLADIKAEKNGKRVAAIVKALEHHAFINEVSDVIAPPAPQAVAEPVKTFRLAERYEALRSAVEAAPEKPLAFLATYGPVNWRRARATFAAGFLGCSGMDVEDNLGFDTPDDILAAVKEKNPSIVVLCSDDESYPALAEALGAKLKEWKNGVQIIVAGNPGEKEEQLRAAGVDAFIHVRTNAAELLTSLVKTLGIALEDGEK